MDDILEFRWESFALAVINFLILCALLYKFLHKPLIQMLDRRKERLEGAREQAEGEAARAREQREQYERRMAGIEEERDNLLSEARKHAEEQREKILEEARERARREVDNLRRGYERERADALKDLQEDIAEIALRTARGILVKLVDADVEERLTHALLDELSAMESSKQLVSDELPVRVISATELDEEARRPLAERIRRLTGEGTEIEWETDEDLIAGARVEFSSAAVDSSLSGVLQTVSSEFMEAQEAAEEKAAGAASQDQTESG